MDVDVGTPLQRCGSSSLLQRQASVSQPGRIKAFSSRRRNVSPLVRTDSLIEWLKGLLHHSFVLDAVRTTAEHTWQYVEEVSAAKDRAGRAPVCAARHSLLALCRPNLTCVHALARAVPLVSWSKSTAASTARSCARG